MKKLIMIGAVISTTALSFAQDENDIVSNNERDVPKNKNGQIITPQKGDIGLSIEASPFLEYGADLLNFNGDEDATSPSFSIPGNGIQLIGKFFKDQSTAYRIGVLIDRFAETDKTFVDQLDQGAAVGGQVEDKVVTRESSIFLTGGLEKRRGYGRLQGLYGAQATLGFSGSSTKTEYGNSIDDELADVGVTTRNNVESKDGTQITFSIEGIIGAEYFFARKMSVGGEFGWGFQMQSTPSGESKTISYDHATGDEDEIIVNTSNQNGTSGLQTTTSGSLFLNLYF